MNSKPLLSFSIEEEYPIKGDLLTQIQNYLRNKKQFSTINSTGNIFKFFLKDKIRDTEESLLITFEITNNKIVKITIELFSDETKINEYDLDYYLKNTMFNIISNEFSQKKQLYTIRNYCYYFNSIAINGDIYLNTDYRLRLRFINSNPRQEPLCQNILYVDTEINAANLDHAISIAYNNTKNVISCLSVLLDVGFEMIHSEYLIFVRATEDELVTERYRTAYLDPELEIIVKDNLNGMKSLNDKDDMQTFFNGNVSYTFSQDIYDIDKSETIVMTNTTKTNLENTFKSLKIKKENIINPDYREDIENTGHFPNTEIKIPQCIRKYYKSIYRMNNEEKERYFSFARLYNLSLTMAKYEPTVMCAYRVASFETLANSINISFSEFIKKYCTLDYDEKLIDFFYGNLRSGHFHAGKFLFNEYNVNMVIEFDFLFKQSKELYFKFNCIVRNTISNLIKENILTKNNFQKTGCNNFS
jgi:hypothetical protein